MFEFSFRYSDCLASKSQLPISITCTALHAVSHGLHVDCNVSDDGFRVRNIHVDDLISTASLVTNKK